MLIPLLGMVICLWLIAHASLRSWLVMAVFFMLGSALYVYTRRSGAASREPNPASGLDDLK